jgi:hypothetical protein
MTSNHIAPVGAWVAYKDSDPSDVDKVAIFGSEIQALRYSNGRGLIVIRWPFGKTLMQAILEKEKVPIAAAPVRARASRRGKQDDTLPVTPEQSTRAETDAEHFADAVERAAARKAAWKASPPAN